MESQIQLLNTAYDYVCPGAMGTPTGQAADGTIDIAWDAAAASRLFSPDYRCRATEE